MAENWPKIGPEISGQIACRYPKHLFVGEQIRNPHQPQMGNRQMNAVIAPDVEPEATGDT